MRYDMRGDLILSQIPDPVVILPPDSEPVTLQEAKDFIRGVTSSADDSLITSLIKAARGWVEKTTGLILFDTMLEIRMDAYPPNQTIPLRGPWLGLTSFQYTDSDGDLQNVDADSYIVESAYKNTTPRIVSPYSSVWPVSIAQSDSVRVRWRAGFADRTGSPTEGASAVPEELLLALKLHVQAHYDRDERDFETIMKAAENLCALHAVSFGVA